MSEQDSSINKTAATDTDTATPGSKKTASKKNTGKKTAGKATRKKTVAKLETPASTVAATETNASDKAGNTQQEQTPSEPTQNIPPATPSKTSTQTRADGSGRLALILVIIVIAVLAWLSWQNDWWSGSDSQAGVQQTEQIDQLQQQFAQLQRAIDSQDVRGEVEPMINAAQDQTAEDLRENLRSSIESQLQPIAGRADDLQLALNDQRSRLSALENRLADVSSEQQQTQTVQNREQSLLEIKLLLRYARQQLLLNNNVDAAIAAYQDAESVLNAADLADSSALQAALISERQSIQATSTSDISALVNELRGLQQAVSLWPLRGQLASNQANRADDQERRWQDKLRDSFSGLVTVRQSETDIISIEQASLIRQQMALHFQTASLLALQGRQAEFQSVINDAQQLLEQSFTADNRGVQAAGETLKSMSELRLTPEWPALDESTEQLNLLDRGAIG